MTQTYLGDNLYTLRKEKGLSQDEFAEKLGVSRQAVSKWERNEAYPDTENLIAISRFYNVTIDDLINKSLDTGASSALSAQPKFSDSTNNDDDDDDDDAKNDGKNGWRIWYNLPYPIIVTVAYLLWGALTSNGWAIGWTLYVTIPIYYSIIDAIRKKRLTHFAYPVIVTFIFLLFGMLFGIWHPLWVIFTTVPIYYSIASAIDRAIRNKRK